jgi:gas vesicle protein
MAQDNGGGGFFAGLMLGGLIGGALALLFAPRPGEETQRMIREKGVELKARMADMSTEDVKRAVKDAIEEGKATASRTKEEMRGKFEQGKTEPPTQEPPAEEIPLT